MSVTDRAGIDDMPPDPAKTVDRIRAALAKRDHGERHRAFPEALLPYRVTKSDLVQPQEHDAQEEGEPITWEDATTSGPADRGTGVGRVSQVAVLLEPPDGRRHSLV